MDMLFQNFIQYTDGVRDYMDIRLLVSTNGNIVDQSVNRNLFTYFVYKLIACVMKEHLYNKFYFSLRLQ